MERNTVHKDHERYQETLPLVSEYGFFQPPAVLFCVWVPHIWRIPKSQNAVAQNLPYHSLKGPGSDDKIESYQLQWHRKTSNFWKEQMNQMECKNKWSQQFRSHPFTKKKSWWFNESAHLFLSHLYGIDDSWQPVCQVPESKKELGGKLLQGVTTRGSTR